jgi:hypothetical protein
MVSIASTQLPVYALSRWGPSLWDAMLACAYVYPRRPSVTDRRNMTAFLMSLAPVLPCGNCRVHFADELASMPDYALDSRKELTRWMYHIQCNIAERKGRDPASFDDFLENVTKRHRRCLRLTWRQMCVVLAVLVVALACCSCYMYTVKKG